MRRFGSALLLLLPCAAPVAAAPPGYAIVVSEATLAAPGWKPVVTALEARHDARGPIVITWKTSPAEAVGPAHEREGPGDTTAALAARLSEGHTDLFVTSGHATERGWQIGYAYDNGLFRSGAGKLWGVDTAGTSIPITSDNPKVWLPVGNCLAGHIDGPDALALAFLNAAGVRQMAGYTVPTWFGYGGWGLLDYSVEQPGRFTLCEAFHANGHALVHRPPADQAEPVTVTFRCRTARQP